MIFDTAKLLYNAPKRDRELGACSFIFTKKKKRFRSASYVTMLSIVIPAFVVLVAILNKGLC